ncbi:MAG: hypothetical protein A3B68_04245 [Candidatus Melainabacteria bacterium RIFCSPHIGHO2_02_FULL_34_12]|nr:MAG: hypothetical protein A3B68_04245 [Candidatus Melainabacteria bacterium RIFCSPHIGHO2_02_FULL_34_12]
MSNKLINIPSLQVLSPAGTLQSFVTEFLALNPSLPAPPTVKETKLRNLIDKALAFGIWLLA